MEYAEQTPPSAPAFSDGRWRWWVTLTCAALGRCIESPFGRIVRPQRCRTAGCPTCDRVRLNEVVEPLHWYKSERRWSLLTGTWADPITTIERRAEAIEETHAIVAALQRCGWVTGGAYVFEVVPMADVPEGAVPGIPCPYRTGVHLHPESWGEAERAGAELVKQCRAGVCGLCAGTGVLPVGHVHWHAVVETTGRCSWLTPLDELDISLEELEGRRQLPAPRCGWVSREGWSDAPAEENPGEGWRRVRAGRGIGLLSWAKAWGFGRFNDKELDGGAVQGAAIYASKAVKGYIATCKGRDPGGPTGARLQALYQAAYMRSGAPGRVRTADTFGNVRGKRVRRIDAALRGAGTGQRMGDELERAVYEVEAQMARLAAGRAGMPIVIGATRPRPSSERPVQGGSPGREGSVGERSVSPGDEDRSAASDRGPVPPSPSRTPSGLEEVAEARGETLSARFSAFGRESEDRVPLAVAYDGGHDFRSGEGEEGGPPLDALSAFNGAYYDFEDGDDDDLADLGADSCGEVRECTHELTPGLAAHPDNAGVEWEPSGLVYSYARTIGEETAESEHDSTPVFVPSQGARTFDMSNEGQFLSRLSPTLPARDLLPALPTPLSWCNDTRALGSSCDQGSNEGRLPLITPAFTLAADQIQREPGDLVPGAVIASAMVREWWQPHVAKTPGWRLAFAGIQLVQAVPEDEAVQADLWRAAVGHSVVRLCRFQLRCLRACIHADIRDQRKWIDLARKAWGDWAHYLGVQVDIRGVEGHIAWFAQELRNPQEASLFSRGFMVHVGPGVERYCLADVASQIFDKFII